MWAVKPLTNVAEQVASCSTPDMLDAGYLGNSCVNKNMFCNNFCIK